MTAQLNLVFFSAIVGSWVIWYKLAVDLLETFAEIGLHYKDGG